MVFRVLAQQSGDPNFDIRGKLDMLGVGKRPFGCRELEVGIHRSEVGKSEVGIGTIPFAEPSLFFHDPFPSPRAKCTIACQHVVSFRVFVHLFFLS